MRELLNSESEVDRILNYQTFEDIQNEQSRDPQDLQD